MTDAGTCKGHHGMERLPNPSSHSMKLIAPWRQCAQVWGIFFWNGMPSWLGYSECFASIHLIRSFPKRFICICDHFWRCICRNFANVHTSIKSTMASSISRGRSRSPFDIWIRQQEIFLTVRMIKGFLIDQVKNNSIFLNANKNRCGIFYFVWLLSLQKFKVAEKNIVTPSSSIILWRLGKTS